MDLTANPDRLKDASEADSYIVRSTVSLCDADLEPANVDRPALNPIVTDSTYGLVGAKFLRWTDAMLRCDTALPKRA